MKQSHTVYEQSPDQLVRYHVPTATDQGTEPKSGLRWSKVTHFQVLHYQQGRGGERHGANRTNTGAW